MFFFYYREIPPGPPATSNMRGLPGPQVPPRNPPSADGKSSSGNSTNDRLLSVSGKKKCSHCKEELGKIIVLYCLYSDDIHFQINQISG